MARTEDDVDDRDEIDDADEVDVKKSKKGKKGKYSDDEKMWAMFSHLGVIVVGFLAPLIIWQMKKDESAFVTRHAKASLNASITWFFIGMLTCTLGFYVYFVFCIIAGLAANRGEEYTYPLTIELIT
jgi:uncharacterized Tic20 family protein